jgi:geranyl-CoA carboxylase alpha subunit
MNTRLQVEHPVTELVTGLDLVAMQIRVAQGQPLGLSQDEVSLCGHAIEARLYAENPSQNFLPATGRVEFLARPEGARFDSGGATRSEVSPFYDPMIAKIIASGPDRETARRKLVRALNNTVLFGVPTNRQFLIDALCADDFISGEPTTAFIGENFGPDELAPRPLTDEVAALAALTQYLAARESVAMSIPQDVLGWCSAHPLPHPFVYEGKRVEVTSIAPDRFHLQCGEFNQDVHVENCSVGQAQYALGSGRKNIHWYMSTPAEIYFQIGAANYHLTNSLAVPPVREDAIGQGDIAAPLHGALTEVFVAKGDEVKIGARLAVVEAMKMQHDILADIAGVVEEVFAKVGDQVSTKALLFKLKA